MLNVPCSLGWAWLRTLGNQRELGPYSRTSYDISQASDWSRWPSRPIRSLRYIVTCTNTCLVTTVSVSCWSATTHGRVESIIAFDFMTWRHIISISSDYGKSSKSTSARKFSLIFHIFLCWTWHIYICYIHCIYWTRIFFLVAPFHCMHV